MRAGVKKLQIWGEMDTDKICKEVFGPVAFLFLDNLDQDCEGGTCKDGLTLFGDSKVLQLTATGWEEVDPLSLITSPSV